MNLPRSKNSACASCHSDMYQPADAFRHDWHASPQGANLACYQCHTPGLARTAATAVACDRCHKDLVPAKALIQVKHNLAPSYVDAMHRTCVGCHRKKAVEKKKPEMAQCAWCHKPRPAEIQARDVILRGGSVPSGSAVLPPTEN
jgi:hypothetical protein